MQGFKLVLKIMTGIPLILISVMGLLITLIMGKFFYAICFVLLLVAYFAICGWDHQRDIRRLRESVQVRGMDLDYFVSYLDNGVVIDLAQQKVLVGNLKNEKILSFNEIKSIEREDLQVGSNMKFRILVNTHDFETPRVGAGFAGEKNTRDAAFAKLSAALKFI